jgi:hypothetical protein
MVAKFLLHRLTERLPDLLCNQSPQPLFNQNRDGYRLEYLLCRFGLRDVATGRMAS